VLDISDEFAAPPIVPVEQLVPFALVRHTLCSKMSKGDDVCVGRVTRTDSTDRLDHCRGTGQFAEPMT
jgi:hypothetical protein